MPKYIDCEQNSIEWATLRLAIPTSSNFHKIITPKKMEMSEQRWDYMYSLLGEWVTGEPTPTVKTEWMEQGQDFELKAVSCYEGLTDQETSRGGFVMSDDGLSGCSPDRLVNPNGGVEVKNRLVHVQIGHLLEGVSVDKVRCQVQGTLMITEREWWDLYSHNDALICPPFRIYRDEQFIKAFRPRLAQFIDEMLAKREFLEKEFGPFVRPEPEQPADHSRDFLTESDVDAILAARGLDAHSGEGGR